MDNFCMDNPSLMEDVTRFEEIYSFFLNTIQDYSIRNLFIEGMPYANEMLKIFLLRAIPEFTNCQKDILNVDEKNETFLVKLDLQERKILSDLMVLSWMDRVINDITQMNMTLSDTDFKHFSEEKNLREKTNRADNIREKVSQDMTNYGLYRTPYDQWAVGNYGIQQLDY